LNIPQQFICLLAIIRSVVAAFLGPLQGELVISKIEVAYRYAEAGIGVIPPGLFGFQIKLQGLDIVFLLLVGLA